MAIKKHNRGKPLGQLGHYTLRKIITMEGGKEKTSTIGIFTGKKLIQDGFKNTIEALEHISNLLKL